MGSSDSYKYLGPRQGSNYRQFFIKGTNTRAEVVYRETVGREPQTPEEVARDRGLPLEAVLESIRYCQENEDLLRQEREEERASIRAQGLDKWPHAPRNYRPDA